MRSYFGYRERPARRTVPDAPAAEAIVGLLGCCLAAQSECASGYCVSVWAVCGRVYCQSLLADKGMTHSGVVHSNICGVG